MVLRPKVPGSSVKRCALSNHTRVMSNKQTAR